ncbi:hypothetical protein [Streptomyces sp. B21-083]|uniref:hypothetical protein n=1 Tax=Streptomyces sp. B21-083 TaxID=3039410 RepID=UPI002FEFF16C
MTDDAPEIDAIPTAYGDVTLRSRLEAKWATFLDSHRIVWQYEPETITLPSGTVYVPDFWLPELGTWIEVKGDGVPRIEKAIEFGKARACHCDGDCTCQWPGGELVLIGHPPKPYDPARDPKLLGAHYTAIANARRRHGGHPNWTTGCGRTAWLGVCQSCCRAGWFLAHHPMRCRSCRQRPTTGRLYAVVELALAFPKDVGALVRPLPADPEREARLAERLVELHEDYEEPW